MWKNGRLTRVLSVSDGKISSSYGTKLASRYTVFGALLYDLLHSIASCGSHCSRDGCRDENRDWSP